MKKQNRVTFKVSLVLPEGATIVDAGIYIEDAVRTMKGSLKPASACTEPDEPYDPMFYLDPDSVRVVRFHKKEAAKARTIEALKDATAALVGASSAYKQHAARHSSVGHAVADPFFTTRSADFHRAAERATTAVREIESKN